MNHHSAVYTMHPAAYTASSASSSYYPGSGQRTPTLMDPSSAMATCNYATIQVPTNHSDQVYNYCPVQQQPPQPVQCAAYYPSHEYGYYPNVVPNEAAYANVASSCYANNSAMMMATANQCAIDEQRPYEVNKMLLDNSPSKTEPPPTQVRQRTPRKRQRLRKDPNEPQKPVSAYALFFRDKQPSIKGQNPNASFGEVSKIVAAMWDGLDAQAKSNYKQRTETAKKDYLKQRAAYRATHLAGPAADQQQPTPDYGNLYTDYTPQFEPLLFGGQLDAGCFN